MCRFLAYAGPPIALQRLVIDPDHSLLVQSQNSTEAKLATNGDGFGLAWYGSDKTPGKFRDINPAWSDSNLPDLCRMVQSGLFMAHVRASTTGATIRANCHPFSSGCWSFMHNGQIGNYPLIRRRLEAHLSDELYYQRQGTTDSELIFLLALQFGLANTPANAIIKTLDLIQAEQQRVGTDAGPTRISIAFSNGTNLFALRWSDDDRAPTLYTSQKNTLGGLVLASEPLGNGFGDWSPLPVGTLCTFTGTEFREQSV